MFCGKCGTKLDDTVCFCPGCGNKVREPAAPVRRPEPAVDVKPPVYTPPAGPSLEKKGIPGVAVLLIFAALSALAIFGLFQPWLDASVMVMGQRVSGLDALRGLGGGLPGFGGATVFGNLDTMAEELGVSKVGPEIFSLVGLWKATQVIDNEVSGFFLAIVLCGALSLPLTWLFLQLRVTALSVVTMLAGAVPLGLMALSASVITQQSHGYMKGEVALGFWLYLAAFAGAFLMLILVSSQNRAKKRAAKARAMYGY